MKINISFVISILVLSSIVPNPVFSTGIINNTFFGNTLLQVKITNTDSSLWEFKLISLGKTYKFSAPELEIDGRIIKMILLKIPSQISVDTLRNDVVQYCYEGIVKGNTDISLKLFFQLAPGGNFLRFKYVINSKSDKKLTNLSGIPIHYFSTSYRNLSNYSEVRFSQFNDQAHSYQLSEIPISNAYFNNEMTLSGPLFAASDTHSSFLVAYEHGSAFPERFLQLKLYKNKCVGVESVKGNYYNGQSIGQGSFSSIWFETGAVKGNQEMLAHTYRAFILNDLSENLESRKPYIYYNTWNFQERNKHWYKKSYLESLNTARMLQEIEAAHRIGIEVFVIDAGWFEKTGDWTPDPKRFPDGLKKIKAKLDSFNMKLGLWLNPTVAAVSSRILKENKDCIKTKDGKADGPSKIWETEESYEMCLVSKYKDAFANELIRLYKELGVTYFKWDAIGQHGCDDPHHQHGTIDNSASEREDCFAFELPRAMSYIVDKLCTACPKAIVDFDITENGRSVGLQFLSSGKYFLINNGPYFFDYNIPIDADKNSTNIFFQPGEARGWICRSPLTYDKWIPSGLFLTHYFPDDPYENQTIAIGSLILGQNGIWGDLPSISEKGINFLSSCLARYKQVRDDMLSQPLIRTGTPGDNPEIYEKINEKTGKGTIVLFANQPGEYFYISRQKPIHINWHTPGMDVHFDKEGYAIIKCDFKKPEAKIVFFGVK